MTHRPAQANRPFMVRYANPSRFTQLSARLLPPLFACAALFCLVGLAGGLGFAPPDYQQGESVRIMYVHVPAAWMAMFCYVLMAIASFAAIVWRHPVADLAARAAAPVGTGFTAITLATGSLWGAPMWGTWWQWDARMTSVLLLLFLYLGYMALWRAIDNPAAAARSAAILCLIGALNLPVIRFSVVYFNTLHQPASVFRLDGPTIDPSMLWPLLAMGLGFTALALALWLMGTRTEIRNRRADAIAERLVAETAHG